MRILRERTGRFVVAVLNRLRVPIEQALRDARLKPVKSTVWCWLAARHKCRWCSDRSASVWQITVSKLRSEHHCPLGAAIQAACRLRNEDIEEVSSLIFALTRWVLKLTVRAYPHFLADY